MSLFNKKQAREIARSIEMARRSRKKTTSEVSIELNCIYREIAECEARLAELHRQATKLEDYGPEQEGP